MGSVTAPKIPTLYLSSEKLKPGTSDWELACNEVLKALQEYGCFEAVYDNITLELHNALLAAMDELFNLPLETKQRNTYPKPYIGYFGDGGSESFEVYDAANLEEVRSFTNALYPEGNPKLCELLYAYTSRVWELEKLVKKMVFHCLGLDKYYNSHVESIYCLFRILNYHAPNSDVPKIGGDEHFDIDFLAISHQNHVNGLEIQTKSGEYIQATPVASSFIITAGEALVAFTNGRVHSPRHRIMIKGNEPRYALSFYSLSRATVKCPEEMVDEQHPLLFKPFDHPGVLNFVYTGEGQEAESILRAYAAV